MNACGDSKGDVDFSTSPFVYDYQLLTKIVVIIVGNVDMWTSSHSHCLEI